MNVDNRDITPPGYSFPTAPTKQSIADRHGALLETIKGLGEGVISDETFKKITDTFDDLSKDVANLAKEKPYMSKTLFDVQVLINSDLNKFHQIAGRTIHFKPHGELTGKDLSEALDNLEGDIPAKTPPEQKKIAYQLIKDIRGLYADHMTPENFDKLNKLVTNLNKDFRTLLGVPTKEDKNLQETWIKIGPSIRTISYYIGQFKKE